MYLPSRKAAKYLGVHPNSLRAWADSGKIKHIKNPAGQRLYDVTTFEGNVSQGRSVCYCRVSSAKQKDDLERQITFMQNKYPTHEIVSDVGSGINFKRKGLRSILERTFTGDVVEIVVAHRDRLSRFGFELIKWLVEKNNCRLVVLDNSSHSPQQELVSDIMSILTVFSCRIHGLRKYANTIKKDSILSEQKTTPDIV